MNPVIARGIAAVGVVLSLVSIWTPLVKSGFGQTPTYWGIPGHGLGIALLVLAVMAAVGLLLASALASPGFDRLWLLAGTAAGGLFLFYPIAVTSSFSANQLRVGSWLGAAAFVLFLVAGALLPLSAASRPVGAMTVPAAPALSSDSAPDEPETGA